MAKSVVMLKNLDFTYLSNSMISLLHGNKIHTVVYYRIFFKDYCSLEFS